MNKPLVDAVALAIRRFRKEHGMSQEALADKAGLDRTYISGVERGVRNITLDSLDQIIRALEVNYKTFFDVVSREVNDIPNQ
jgi:transcriptional regulator with XRE-family HTH domain